MWYPSAFLYSNKVESTIHRLRRSPFLSRKEHRFSCFPLISFRMLALCKKRTFCFIPVICKDCTILSREWHNHSYGLMICFKALWSALKMNKSQTYNITLSCIPTYSILLSTIRQADGFETTDCLECLQILDILIYGRRVCFKAGDWTLCTILGYGLPEREICDILLLSFIQTKWNQLSTDFVGPPFFQERSIVSHAFL